MTAKPDFALASLAAWLLLYIWVGLSVFMSIFRMLDEGISQGLGYFLYSLIQTGILFAFVYFLNRGSKIVAVLFFFWCASYFLTAIAGDDNAVAAIFGYILGVLGFVGICGVLKGFAKEKTP